MSKMSKTTRYCGVNLGLGVVMSNERKRQNPTKRNHSYDAKDFDRLQPLGAQQQPKSNSHNTSLVFFGSGPVAAASLKSLYQHFTIEAVVTKPITATEMSEAAPNTPVRLVNTKQELTNLMASNPFKSSLGIIVDFGIIVEQAVIDYFDLGIINSHFSLLPEWRGADPITFAVLSGQPKTGVSLMLIVERLDEGPLLAQSELELEPTITTPELTDQLVELGNKMLSEVLPLYMDDQLRPFEQPEDVPATYSRKLTKADGQIDWNKPARKLEREVRAFQGWPGSYTTLANKRVIITKAHVLDEQGEPGKVLIKDKQLMVHCQKQALAIDELKPEGKKEMSGSAFVAGHKDKLI